MNQLTLDKRKQVVAALVEGSSINSIVRMTGIAKTTILRLLRVLGSACAAFHDERLRRLKPQSVQCDEVWSFNFCKQENVSKTKLRDITYGDTYTWTAIDPQSKLVISFLVGTRTAPDARAFMLDLAGRINNVTQITTDGLGSYPEAIRSAFGDMVDYAQLIKVYKEDRQSEVRYSPATCIGCEDKTVQGFPNSDHISTSHVERSNLTVRMSMRHFTRLTNAHSKKIENHGHAFALFTAHYNFCRKHMSLNGQTPAMAAGLADHAWSLEELIGLIP